jgi:hypothetical protein
VSSRLRTDFFVAALRRTAEGAGAFVSIARRGAEEAGAVFVVVDRLDGRLDLYGPAPQSVFYEVGQPSDRLFSLLLADASAEATHSRMEQEMRFDPDLWQIDIEDRQGRPFLDLAAEDPGVARYTPR